MTFWETPTWKAYEVACGVSVSRVDELAAATWQTRVVDLRLSEAELWKGLTKGTRSDVKRQEQTYQTSWSCPGTAADFADRYIALHRQKNHDQRPLDTYAPWAQWAQDGHGLIVIGWKDWQAAGAIYVLRHERWAYFASEAIPGRDLGALLQWRAMEALKSRGVEFYELGWQAREWDDDKDRGIAAFKRHFGGFDLLAREAPQLYLGGQHPTVAAMLGACAAHAGGTTAASASLAPST